MKEELTIPESRGDYWRLAFANNTNVFYIPRNDRQAFRDMMISIGDYYNGIDGRITIDIW
jgi:hypothetical protein